MEPEKKCTCQLCKCPNKQHKCVYGPDEEYLSSLADSHCRNCNIKKGKAPYVPKGTMEKQTTYSRDFARDLNDDAFERNMMLKSGGGYRPPTGKMLSSTTYSSDFGVKDYTPEKAHMQRAGYARPTGPMASSTTYTQDFQEIDLSDGANKVFLSKHQYTRPTLPMQQLSTYAEQFTEKSLDRMPDCCPSCFPEYSGYMMQGVENGHTIYVKRT